MSMLHRHIVLFVTPTHCALREFFYFMIEMDSSLRKVLREDRCEMGKAQVCH